jgi:hypothetical protein
MFETVFPRSYGAWKALVAMFLAAIFAGCSGDAGTVAATPPKDGGEVVPVKGAPRVPRGPEAAKALQENPPTKKK